MPKIYIEVSIAERMPIVENPRSLDKVVLIDNCGVKHLRVPIKVVQTGRDALLQLGYTHCLEEVEVSQEVMDLIQEGGGDD